MSTRFLRATAVAAVAALSLTACTDDEPDATTSPSPTASAAAAAFPVTVTADNGEFTFDAAPQRIVSLSPTATEMLYAVGAGDQVVAVDPFSYFPPEAPVDDSLNTFPEPSVEAISAFEPDLVVFQSEPGTLADSLASIGVTAVQFETVDDFEEIYTQIERIGAITGHIAGAAAVVAQMQTDLDAVLANLPEGTAGLTYFHEISPDYYTSTSSTFIGKVYALLGLVNIADEAGAAAGTDFPQMNAEEIVEADPDLIFLADANCCEQTPESVAGRDGWAEVSAVVNGGVIVVDEDLASRWGPRIVQFLEEVVTALQARADALVNA
ncbi:MAG: ABC transporter substrate-binding protein [Nitriliruptorales bacterium]|nr:ABC transporter substrate-binding protein [Nitriliruptorales bacterium]